MLVVSHESIGVVAFSPWAALSCILSNTFELHLEQHLCRDRDCWCAMARSVATQQSQPGRSCTKRKLAL